MNSTTQWNERFLMARTRLNLDQEEFGRRIGVSREWISKLERSREIPSELLQFKLIALERQIEGHKKESYFTPIRTTKDQGIDGVVDEGTAMFEEVALRKIGKRSPSTRTDCEAYMLRLLDAAEISDNPDAFPVIHDRLTKKFPIDEWEKNNEPIDQ